ncbi:type IV pilus twitching motility protein PilT [Chengkuizengella axinellae]|uniref:Type IV pilus twitching motility protein PilT n=1 Tax=Chengkuizengella axinellae TaxID=3064388 RepID=A0ABT9IY62_9BACL|nr:type IV pilus twitching motility protein PilT [Chengkuizengella sp. 2205SS18-9]MDP5274300.1 type IV pilus twitching motility protein PilT [Chengkuizengella sp. 2205SS18-9]
MKREFEVLLKNAFESGASDLHLSVRSPPIMRVNGVLKPLDTSLLEPSQTEAFAKSILTKTLYVSFEQNGEVDFSISVPGISRFRVNVYRQRNSVSIAARIVPTTIPSLEELDLPLVLSDLSKKNHGLVLVTGPTGSGKSTTLAAMINYINQNERKHIITLEDPIEYLHSHGKSIIDQREIGSDTMNFTTGLRAALRQDPDVLLVGEMRDPETISTAITAAETGHLVLATLHTIDAMQTIDRIVDSFPGSQQAQIRIQLSLVLEGVVSQRLLTNKSGQGRICATEVLMNTHAVANLIRNEKVHQLKSIMQTNAMLGMHTMEMSLKELLRKNQIDEKTAKTYLSEGTGQDASIHL